MKRIRKFLLPLLTLHVISAPVLASSPAHDWSHGFGGAGYDEGWGVAIDVSGNIYTCGNFEGTVNFGGGDLVSAGGWDLFVAKYDPDGAHIWSQRFGSSAEDESYGIAVDASGDVIVTGLFGGTINFGGGDLISEGKSDVFVVKFNSAGVQQWSHSFGGNQDDQGWAVDVDDFGNVYVTGAFQSSFTLDDHTLASSGRRDMFLVNINPSGIIQWAQAYGGSGEDEGYSVETDGIGRVLVTGYFTGSANFGGGDFVSNGMADLYIARYKANGTHQWSQAYGSFSADYGESIVTDPSNSVIVAGCTEGYLDFGGGALPNNGQVDIFVAKFNSDGTHQWSESFGDTNEDFPFGVAVDGSGGVLIAGGFEGSVDFGGGSLISNGSADVFLVKYSALGTHDWSQRFGGAGYDYATAVKVAGSGTVALIGTFEQVIDFGGGDLVEAGSGDVFLANFSPVTVSTKTTDVHGIRMKQNVPNPFSKMTTIEYTLSEESKVTIGIYDIGGRLVVRVDEGTRPAGTYQVQWDGLNDQGNTISKGVYYCALKVGTSTITKRLIFLNQ